MLTESQKDSVRAHFFKIFFRYKKPNETRDFITRWLQILYSYAQMPNFVCFEPQVPIITFLKSRAHAVLVVANDYKKPKYYLRNVSIFSLYAYRIQLIHTSESFRSGLEFLILYLKLTGIRLLGFYKLEYQQDYLIPELEKNFPDLRIYGSDSFPSFKLSVR